RNFWADLSDALNRDARLSNDANCFALSEAADGAAASSACSLGVIIGTGCGAGIVINGQIVNGPRGTGGEWGHSPLPSPTDDERPGPLCWCGRTGCMETWVSGPGLQADHWRATGEERGVEDIVALAHSGDAAANATLERHLDRLARGLSGPVNVLDPDIVVLGGGVSEIPGLASALSERLAEHIFADDRHVAVVTARWGPSSGVRGAARLCFDY
ncbi:MAG: ROK family protein, partial [Pseudomonadota bacterium]